jgi:hypothetical protein
MDIGSLMWDETGRNLDEEQRDLARTAALTDAEMTVGQFVYLAVDTADLGHRMALAEPQLQAIATRRGYPMQNLTKDLGRRWQMLTQARTATVAARRVTAAQERAMDVMVARLAAVAAKDNPAVPMQECLRLATEAVRKHADAYPLAYESWGGTHDGPITQRVKNFQPETPMPKAYDPSKAPTPDPDMYEGIHKRLDDLEGKLPPAAASLDPTVAGFYQRLKDWWHGPQETTAPSSSAHPAPTGYVPSNAASQHVEDAVDRVNEHEHDRAGQREFDEIMRRLDNDQADMNHKWDNPGYNDHRDWRTHKADADRMEQAGDAARDAFDRRTTSAGAPAYDPAPIQHDLFG